MHWQDFRKTHILRNPSPLPHRTIAGELRRHVPRGRLEQEHVDVLQNYVLRIFVAETVRLWRLTAKVSVGGKEREGQAVASIQAAEAAEKERLRTIKQRGVDAKFTEPSRDDAQISERVAEFSVLVQRIADQLGGEVVAKSSDAKERAKSDSAAKEREPSTPHDALLQEIRRAATSSSTNDAKDADGPIDIDFGDSRARIFEKPVLQAGYM